MNLLDLEKNLDFGFKNKALLKQALTHRSYLNEHPNEGLISNERLEFLGDAILEFTISKILFERFPTSSEGFLTAFRSKVVQTKTLAALAKTLELGKFLFFSKGEEESGGRENPALLENGFEALIGAIFLDQGIGETSLFVKKHFNPIIAACPPEKLKDAKSLLQEQVQEKEKITPTYKVLCQTGPDHAKIFTVAVCLNKKQLATAQGRSKQEAEDKAAQAALEKLRNSK